MQSCRTFILESDINARTVCTCRLNEEKMYVCAIVLGMSDVQTGLVDLVCHHINVALIT